MSTQQNVMAIIQKTPPTQIAELDFVQQKFIQNYNACNKGGGGEMMYHRQLVHFKQAIAGSEQLKKADPFSLYACFVTAAVNGYSLDPQDNEVYLIPRGGKAFLDRQAGAHVKRLIRTGQIQFAEQAKLVYAGDTFKVVNGRVILHEENYQSETIVAGYVRFALDTDTGADRYFIYRKSDWETWRKKSQMPNGDNWAGNVDKQPQPGFLRTKIILHACKEKCWATGMTPATVEVFEGVEIDSEEVQQPLNGIAEQQAQSTEAKPLTVTDPKEKKPAKAKVESKDHFAEVEEAETVTIEDDDETF